METRLLAALVGLAIPAVLPTGLSGASAAPPYGSGGPILSVSHAGLRLRATPGSFCVTPPAGDEGGFGGCADYAYPLRTRGRLPVRPSGTLVLKTSVRARTLSAGLLTVDGSSIEPVDRRLAARRTSHRRWVLDLPGDLGDANVLNLTIVWRNGRDGRGDANFWAGIRQDCGSRSPRSSRGGLALSA